MADLDDIALLREFVQNGSEPAFATLVERHVNLVYSVALRKTANAHAAQEISQAVFIILARKAKMFGTTIVLPGWLYKTTQLTAANYIRGEIRRQKREQEAYMESLANEPEPDVWPQVAPLLDDAMAKLRTADRDAIVLRFFQNKSLREVGVALGTGEDAAKMRVNRALDKMRQFFTRRGVKWSAAAIGTIIAANSVQAAPTGLTGTISVAVAQGPAVTASTLALVKGTIKTMLYAKLKLALGIAAAVLLTAGAVDVAMSGDSNAEKTSSGQATEQETSFANDLIKATADVNYDLFVSHGDKDFKTLTKKDFKAVCTEVKSHMKSGYHVVFLGGLKQAKSHITLWKVSYDDNSDDDMLTMSLQNGQINGAILTPPFH